ncbi:MAG: elongation factor P maturation arginine rhamnosyltransferase EarP [Proteobacteria bacterium]|nr:elongation factor P maturation arginine rhamnosyltransferase EarP [Pseudomonadota bacterium]
MYWDVFCRVIDNHGDLGVCWRLARDLATRGRPVRLWVDDARALAWMAPGGAPGVTVLDWHAPPQPPGAVVIEAFGCDPPPAFVAQLTPRQVWINLEYLSAEAYVERSHALPSPQASGLVKWFYYPGFTPATGGLIREPGLAAAQAAFDPDAWLAARGVARQPGALLISAFTYPAPHLAGALATLLAAGQAQVLTAPGVALPGQPLPWLTQDDYDRLLWACDLNLVRGEDSFVRAQWAGAPMLWQIYPQHDGAHAAKLEAFIARMAPDASQAAWLRAWGGVAPVPQTGPNPDDWATWQNTARRWRATLSAQPDLTTQLLAFVAARQAGA